MVLVLIGVVVVIVVVTVVAVAVVVIHFGPTAVYRRKSLTHTACRFIQVAL